MKRQDASKLTDLASAARWFFTQRGPRIIAAKAVATCAVRVALGRPRARDFAVAAGVLAWWPLQEWLAHRHLLHLRPRPGFDPMFARKHREHHRDPRRADLTLLPVPVVVAAAAANVAGWFVACRDKRLAVTGIAAYSTAALIYEWTHFLVHTGHKPNSEFFSRIRRNHLNHHFLNENYWLGFTWPGVDAWLGTEPDPKTVPRSATARDLHADVDPA